MPTEKRTPGLWATCVNLYGLYSKRPQRIYYDPEGSDMLDELEGKYSWWAKNGDFGGHYPYAPEDKVIPGEETNLHGLPSNYAEYVSSIKKNVEEYMRGAQTVFDTAIHSAETAVKNITENCWDANGPTPYAKGAQRALLLLRNFKRD